MLRFAATSKCLNTKPPVCLLYTSGEGVVGIERPKEAVTKTEGNVVSLVERREQVREGKPQKVREYVYYPETFEPLGLIEGEEGGRCVYHYHNDPNGCPTRLTDVSGEVKWGVRYTAWGLSLIHI